METQTIKKSIDINAAKEKVWEVLFTDKFNKNWYAAFSKGSYAITDWQAGSKAIFTDDSCSGLVGKVLVNNPGDLLSIEYQGVYTDGKEDYESDIAKAIKGGMETYRLTEKEAGVQLYIECDMAADYFETMSAAWDKALEKVKELAETK